VIFTTKEACPVLSLGTLWTFFNKFYYIFGILMILMGIFLMIFGGRYYKATMFIAGQITVVAILMILMFVSVYPSNSPMWVVWLTLVVSVILGGGIGYATQRWARIGVLLIGAWIGGLLGGVLYSLVFYLFAEDNPLLVLWLTILFTAIVVSILSMVYFDYAVIFGAGIAGAYMFVRVIFLVFNFIGYF
jgi:hypothetical protein